jgi:hypothetical protein
LLEAVYQTGPLVTPKVPGFRIGLVSYNLAAASDRNGLPDGTSVGVDVDPNESGSFADAEESGYTGSAPTDRTDHGFGFSTAAIIGSALEPRSSPADSRGSVRIRGARDRLLGDALIAKGKPRPPGGRGLKGGRARPALAGHTPPRASPLCCRAV